MSSLITHCELKMQTQSACDQDIERFNLFRHPGLALNLPRLRGIAKQSTADLTPSELSNCSKVIVAKDRFDLRIYFCLVSAVFDFAFVEVSVFASRYPAFLASSSDMN